jgi:hypothetical protein|tara:strand:+ start:2279 stop:2740 length:462 start_codon:yes stop_codon:yes gene_type:complete
MKKKMTKTYHFDNKTVKPEFIDKTNKVRMRVVDQTCLDKLLLDDSISLDDFMILDKFQMDYNRSGMVGIKASNYNPRITSTYDTTSNDNEILRRKVTECLGFSRSAGGSRIYDILMKILTDKDLTRIDIEFIKNNILEIVKPIKEFYESWRNS